MASSIAILGTWRALFGKEIVCFMRLVYCAPRASASDGPLNPAPIKGSDGYYGYYLSKTVATHATKSDETLSNA